MSWADHAHGKKIKTKFKKINWEPVTGNEDWGYLHIHDKDNITMRYDKDFKLLEFWESLACDYWNKRRKL